MFFPLTECATIPSEHNVLTCVLTCGNMYRLGTALYPTEKIAWCLCAIHKQRQMNTITL